MRGPGRENYGALVGWTSSWRGDRITLRIQSVDKPPPHSQSDIHTHVFVLGRQQAVQLGNNLFDIAEAQKPTRRARGLFARLFG